MKSNKSYNNKQSFNETTKHCILESEYSMTEPLNPIKQYDILQNILGRLIFTRLSFYEPRDCFEQLFFRSQMLNIILSTINMRIGSVMIEGTCTDYSKLSVQSNKYISVNNNINIIGERQSNNIKIYRYRYNCIVNKIQYITENSNKICSILLKLPILLSYFIDNYSELFEDRFICISIKRLLKYKSNHKQLSKLPLPLDKPYTDNLFHISTIKMISIYKELLDNTMKNYMEMYNVLLNCRNNSSDDNKNKDNSIISINEGEDKDNSSSNNSSSNSSEDKDNSNSLFNNTFISNEKFMHF